MRVRVKGELSLGLRGTETMFTAALALALALALTLRRAPSRRGY